MKKHKSFKSIYTEMVFFYTAILIILLVVVGIVVYSVSAGVIMKRINEVNLQKLILVCSSNDEAMDRINTYMLSISQETTLKSEFSDLSTENQIYMAQQLFKKYQTESSIISTGIYYKDEKRMLSSQFGMIPEENLADKDWISYYNEIQPVGIVPVYSYNDDKLITIMRGFPFGIRSQELGVIVVEVSRSRLFENVMGNSFGGHTLVINENNQVIAGDGEFYETILNSVDLKSDADYYTVNFKGDKYLLTQVESDTYGWKYINLQNCATIYKELNNVRVIIVLLMLICAVLGFYFSRHTAKRFYTPVKKIIKTTGYHHNENTSGNELDVLAQMIDMAVKKEKDIEVFNTRNKYSIFQGVLYNLCFGKLNKQEERFLLERLTNIGFSFKNRSFAAFVVGIEEQGDEFFSSVYKDARLTSDIFDNTDIILAGIQDEKIAVLVSFEGDVDRLLSLAEDFKDFLYKEYRLMCSVGVGNICHTLREYRSSFEEAMTALQYREKYDNAAVIFINECGTETSNLQRYYYPVDKEAELMRAIQLGRIDDAEKAVSDIYGSIISVNSELDFVSDKLWQIYNSILRTLSSMGISCDEVMGNSVENLLRYQELKYLNEKYEYIMERVKKTIEYIENKQNTNHEMLVEKIKQYVEENYYQDLCLETFSAMYKFTPNYISHIFKIIERKGIRDYIKEVRMKKAAELILASDFKTEEISLKVGYESSRTFFRNFKSYYGVTPSEYRQIHSETKNV